MSLWWIERVFRCHWKAGRKQCGMISLRSTRIGVRVITTLKKGWKQIGWNFFCYAVNIQLMSFILYYTFKQKLSTSFHIILHRQCCFSFVFDDMCQGNVSASCIFFLPNQSRQTNTDARYLETVDCKRALPDSWR